MTIGKHLSGMGKRHLDPKIFVHRSISYPQDFKKKYQADPEVLAKAGFYFLLLDDGTVQLRCHFCPTKIEECDIPNWTNLNVAELLGKKPYCPIESEDSGNVPLIGVNYLNYYFESHRLYSLLQKKDDWKFVTPESLAADGFHYTGKKDCVRCKFCNLEIRGWEDGDKVRTEHQLWNAGCPFLNNPSSVQNILIGDEQLGMEHDAIGEKKNGTRIFPTDDTQGVENPPDVDPLPIIPHGNGPPEDENMSD